MLIGIMVALALTSGLPEGIDSSKPAAYIAYDRHGGGRRAYQYESTRRSPLSQGTGESSQGTLQILHGIHEYD
jgi:hypothetical protein